MYCACQTGRCPSGQTSALSRDVIYPESESVEPTDQSAYMYLLVCVTDCLLSALPDLANCRQSWAFLAVGGQKRQCVLQGQRNVEKKTSNRSNNIVSNEFRRIHRTYDDI